MAKNRVLKQKQLRRALKSYGVNEDPSRGKGSHTLYYKVIDGGRYTYPVPTTREPVLECYVKGARRKFRLTEQDGVSDDEFFSRT